MSEKADRPALGFVGVGTMGGGMARNLLKAGYGLTVFDLAEEKVAALVDLGASAATSARDVVRQSEITLVSLPTSGTFVEVMEAPEAGILAGLAPGKVIVDAGTTAAPETRRLAARVRELGGDMLDAPVSGGGGGADAGTLAVMVGGSEAAYERCRPILDIIGGNVVRLGDAGAGQVGKAVNQIAMGVAGAAFLEALFLGVRAGLDPEKIWQVLRTAGAANTSFAAAARHVIGGRAESRDLKLRELPYFIAEAEAQGVNLPLTETLCRFAYQGENRTQDPLGIPTPSYWYELMHRGREG